MAWTGVITNQGEKLLSEWMDEAVCRITGAYAGSGTVKEAVMLAQTDVAGTKREASIVAHKTVNQGRKISVQVQAEEAEYRLYQIGIWASLNSANAVMLALFQNEEGVRIPAQAESPDFVYNFHAVLSVSGQGELQVTMDPSALVSQGSMQAAIAAACEEKQDKLTGAPGQIVGFNENGEVEAREPPEGDFLPLSGGTLTGNIAFSDSTGPMFYNRAALVYDNVAGALACVPADQIAYASPDYAPFACGDPTGTAHAATKSYVDEKVSQAGGGPYYATCATAYSTTAKVAVCEGFQLATGATVIVKFTYYNTATSPTLNVNGTGAKAIKKYGTTGSMAYMWYSGEMVQFTYDGTYWVMTKGMTATTTYYGLTKLSDSLTDYSTTTAATPSAVRQVNLTATEALALAKEHTHNAQDVFASAETTAALGGLTFQNLVTNGSFEHGSEGWTFDAGLSIGPMPTWGPSGQHGENVLGGYPFSTVEQHDIAGIDPTHTYYFRMLASTDGSVSSATVQVYMSDPYPESAWWTIFFGEYMDLSISPMTTVSAICTALHGDTLHIAISDSNPHYVDAVLLVDLTAAFGAGNEPTKEECDRCIVYSDTVCTYKVSVDEALQVANKTVFDARTGKAIKARSLFHRFTARHYRSASPTTVVLRNGYIYDFSIEFMVTNTSNSTGYYFVYVYRQSYSPTDGLGERSRCSYYSDNPMSSYGSIKGVYYSTRSTGRDLIFIIYTYSSTTYTCVYDISLNKFISNIGGAQQNLSSGDYLANAYSVFNFPNNSTSLTMYSRYVSQSKSISLGSNPSSDTRVLFLGIMKDCIYFLRWYSATGIQLTKVSLTGTTGGQTATVSTNYAQFEFTDKDASITKAYASLLYFDQEYAYIALWADKTVGGATTGYASAKVLKLDMASGSTNWADIRFDNTDLIENKLVNGSYLGTINGVNYIAPYYGGTASPVLGFLDEATGGLSYTVLPKAILVSGLSGSRKFSTTYADGAIIGVLYGSNFISLEDGEAYQLVYEYTNKMVTHAGSKLVLVVPAFYGNGDSMSFNTIFAGTSSNQNIICVNCANSSGDGALILNEPKYLLEVD